MKKTYMKPVMAIHQLRLQRMITTSDPTLRMAGAANKAGEVLSRQSDWDDEE